MQNLYQNLASPPMYSDFLSKNPSVLVVVTNIFLCHIINHIMQHNFS